MLDVVDNTITSSLRSDEASTPVQALPSEHTSKLIPELLVGTEEETNLASTGTNITGCNSNSVNHIHHSKKKSQLTRNVSVLSNVSVKLEHESVAEPTDFAVGLALGVEIGPTLSTTHVQTGECVLEGLFETQELEDGKVD